MSKATVEYSLTRALNLGNYESVKVHVGLSLDCDGSRDAVESVFEKAKRFVDEKIAKEEHEWKVGEA